MAATPLHHPLTGESVAECARRMIRECESVSEAHARAQRLALSVLAKYDGSAEFYAAVAASLSNA